jgi:transposase InsO family protein
VNSDLRDVLTHACGVDRRTQKLPDDIDGLVACRDSGTVRKAPPPGTFKRDYVAGAELRDAEAVLAQLVGWFGDYNTQAPHLALGMRSPAEYRGGAAHSKLLAVSRTSGSTPL